MSSWLLALCTLFVLITIPRDVFAQTAVPTVKGNRLNIAVTKVQQKAERVNDRIETMEQRQASLEARLEDRKKNAALRIREHARRMFARTQSAIERTDKAWIRVESRIKTFEENGADVSSLQALQSDVAVKKKAAQQAIADAETALAALESSDSIKTTVTAYAGQFKLVKNALKSYHQSIIAVIRNMKGMSTAAGQNTLTPTPTT